jgi:hypothetical protein
MKLRSAEDFAASGASETFARRPDTIRQPPRTRLPHERHKCEPLLYATDNLTVKSRRGYKSHVYRFSPDRDELVS